MRQREKPNSEPEISVFRHSKAALDLATSMQIVNVGRTGQDRTRPARRLGKARQSFSRPGSCDTGSFECLVCRDQFFFFFWPVLVASTSAEFGLFSLVSMSCGCGATSLIHEGCMR